MSLEKWLRPLFTRKVLGLENVSQTFSTYRAHKGNNVNHHSYEW